MSMTSVRVLDGSDLTRSWLLYQGLIFVIVMLFVPDGIGGLISTAKDQLRYARFHMGDGTAPGGAHLLAPESMALMQTPQVAADDGNLMGLSWFLRDVDGQRIVRTAGPPTANCRPSRWCPPSVSPSRC